MWAHSIGSIYLHDHNRPYTSLLGSHDRIEIAKNNVASIYDHH